jgi:hypothetical protein
MPRAKQNGKITDSFKLKGCIMLKNITKKYKDFIIDIHINSETIYVYWTDGDIENSRRFSGYSINEILDIVEDEINSQELTP